MTEFRKVQADFHRGVDRKRFLNRLRNPYIRTRERRLFAKVREALGPDCRRILEIGCGEGSNYVYLEERYPEIEYVGMDFSFAKTAGLAEWFPKARAVCGDATELPFRDSHFDAVLCRDLLHHVNFARGDVVKEALRVTKLGGRVLILEADGRTLLNRIFRLLRPAERGMKDSSPAKLQSQLSPHGLIDFQFVESSQLVRALAYFFGWPASLGRILLAPLYAAAALCEKLIALVIPRSRWAVMLFRLRQEEPGLQTPGEGETKA